MAPASRLCGRCAFTIGLAVLSLVPAGARAATVTQSFQAKYTVNGTCTTTTPSTLDFGTITASASGATAQTTASTSATIMCTSGLPFDEMLTSGNGSNGTYTMKSGSNALNYQVFFQNAIVSGCTTVNYTCPYRYNNQGFGMTGSASNLTQYFNGRILAQSSVPAGTYTYTMTFTVIW